MINVNKSILTNVLATICLALGIFLSWKFPQYIFLATYIQNAGLFALSGAITNWLAIYMLFEKIPFLYGSGIIPNNFQSFINSIKSMMLENFFSEENFTALSNEIVDENIENHNIDIDAIQNSIDTNKFFDAIVDIIKESKYYGMISLIGGTSIIEGYRKKFNEKFNVIILDTLETMDFQKLLINHNHNSYSTLKPKIEKLIDKKLSELSPQHVKEIISKIIKEHLDWLVVWGGFFGALIGLISTFFTFLFK